jgi:hypothetical protein
MQNEYFLRCFLHFAQVFRGTLPTPEKRIYTKKNQGGWGCNWFLFSKMVWKQKTPWRKAHAIVTISGHLSNLPRAGDEFHVPMQSGKTLRCVVKSARYPVDPPDQFFADCEATEYVEGGFLGDS